MGGLKNIYPVSKLEVEKNQLNIEFLFDLLDSNLKHQKATHPTLALYTHIYVSSGKTKLTFGAFELFCVSWLHISAELIRNTERNALHFIKVIQMNPG